MADNLTTQDTTLATVPTSSVIATLESGGVHYQRMMMRPDDTVSTNNSTTATLGISGTFTGTGDDLLGYASVSVILDASHDSATDGIDFQFSSDNSNWDYSQKFTLTASENARIFQLPVSARYFRLVYTNGGTGQTHFRVQTILHRNNILTSIHRLVNNTSPDRSAQIVKAAIIAQQAGAGDFIPVQSTAGGNLKISIEEIDGAVIIDVGGDVAHDTADSGDPVKVGGKAYNFDGTAPGTAVAEADRANFISDVYGRQFVETAHPNRWHVSADYASAQTNTSLKAAPGAGLRLYITDVVISNGATAGNITLLDGSGGSVVFELYPAINGGAAMPFTTPIPLTANTALVITSTTVTTHSVTINGYIAP